MNQNSATFILRLTPAPGNWTAPAERRLARFLKTALRAYGLKCTSATALNDENDEKTKVPDPGPN